MHDPQVPPHHGSVTPRPRRFLGIFAHPDDETFCAGGTFAKYAAQGVEIMVISATRGEAGQIRDATVATRRTIAAAREREFFTACQRIGVRQARCLDYPDGGLADGDLTPLVTELTAIIRTFQPTTLVTFGPDGGYGHPDHMAINDAATTARDNAANPHHLCAGMAPHRTATTYFALFPQHRRRLLDRIVQWLMSHDERFRGDAGFIKALLHLSEEARDLGSIADHIETRWFPAGTYVVEQGEAATTLYLILSGEAEAVREHADGTTEVLGPLQAGQFFGEIGIATHRPRNAHVIARTNVTCLQFSPIAPQPYLGRGEGARLTSAPSTLAGEIEDAPGATTRIDVRPVIEQKIAAIAAYRSQFAFEPNLLPAPLLGDLFGTEYFQRAHPTPPPETEIV